MKTGIFLARMQPLHNAHMWMVEQACKENDKVIVVLGSANKKDMLRNPFEIGLRENLLREAISASIGLKEADKITVLDLPDWSQESDVQGRKEWGSYLYYNIVACAQCKDFTFYFSDNPDIMLGWFDDNIRERLSFRFFARTNLFEGLSATNIREAFMNDDKEYVKKYCPETVYRRFEGLKATWLDVSEDPKEDFTM